MSLLLDTHVFVWWRAEAARIDESTRDLIANTRDVFVSVASAWEAAVKVSVRKLSLPEPFEAGLAESRFSLLQIGFRHTERVARLPFHHKDPFDRMLIAQAMEDGLILVTSDRLLTRYGAQVRLF